jgi:probable HAF family extracellular repeat protein
MRSWNRAGAVAFASLLAAGVANAEASLTELDFDAVGVSADGSAVVGLSYQGSYLAAVRWTAETGVQLLSPPAVNAQGAAVSELGAVVAGRNSTSSLDLNYTRAFRWAGTTGMQDLGDLPGGTVHSLANGISGDGTIIVGQSASASGTEAFRWTLAGGMVGLGDLPGGTFLSIALGISDDGSTIVGGSWSEAYPNGEAFYWTAENGMVGIGNLHATPTSSAWGTDASEDGSVIVGYSSTPNGVWEAFRWTAEGGMVGLGDLPGGSFQSFARGVSGDGSIVVGESVTGPTGSVTEAFIWDEVGGMRPLKQVLESFGLDLTGWRVHKGHGISADGTAFAISGIKDGEGQSWRAVIPIPEPSHAVSLGAGVAGLVSLDLRRHRRRTRSEVN